MAKIEVQNLAKKKSASGAGVEWGLGVELAFFIEIPN